MENDTSDKKSDAASAGASDSDGKPEKKKSFAGFLIDSGIMPLVFMGKCVDYFGLGAVVGLLLGAGIVYGVALFRPLPYAAVKGPNGQPSPTPTPPPVEAKRIRLHGFVRGQDDKPVAEPFVIAILASQHGPIRATDGSFSIQVPQSNQYDIAVWNAGYTTVRVYSGYIPEADGEGFTLGSIPFFTSVSASSNELLRTKSAGPTMAESQKLNYGFNFQNLSSE